MIRESMFVLLLSLPLHALAADPPVPTGMKPVPNGSTPPASIPAVPNASTPTVAPVAPIASAPVIPPPPIAVPVVANGGTPAAVVLPPMKFLASVAGDDVLAAFKADPAFAALDKELAGSPLALVVTHTVRPTAAGTAAGLLSAVLSGGTLGILPVVSNDRLVVRYEVMLNGKTLTSYTFERTATRAQNLWTAGNDGTGGLGKGGVEWVKSTAAEVAGKLARDPAMIAVRDEMEFYFPSTGAKAASTAK